MHFQSDSPTRVLESAAVLRKGVTVSTASDPYQLFLTTAGSAEQAETIARELVERRLAACVNVVGQTCSIYRWKGKVECEDEKLLLIKSRKSYFSPLREALRELHSYEVPELLAFTIAAGDPEYLAWIDDCLD